MHDDLKAKILEAIKYSGYPLEQRVGYLLQNHGWGVFFSVNYHDPITEKERELDILAYKIINDRRIELRISCKRSPSKPWVLFTEESEKYYQHGSILKITPVSSDIERYRHVTKVLHDLPYFSHPRRAINFTVFTGKELNSEARSIMKDGILSSLNSVYHRIFPYELLFDERGTVYFFITVFDGLLFESWYDSLKDKDEIKQIHYGQWHKKLELVAKQDTIENAIGKRVPLYKVIYWFSEWFQSEIITWDYFPEYLGKVEQVFENIPQKDLRWFGKPWRDENFPKNIGPRPSF